MEKRFTKGQWRVSEYYNLVHVSKPGLIEGDKVICDINENVSDNLTAEVKANTILIASSPIMLESSEKNKIAWEKILSILPDPESMDYDPGDILMRIECIAHSNLTHTASAIKKALEG